MLGWQEEQTRFAFQNGDAVFMRNWPYACPLLQDPAGQRVAGRFAVRAMPAGHGGAPTAALGGAALAINAFSDRKSRRMGAHSSTCSQPEQMIERARVPGEYPPRPALYDTRELADALPMPRADALAIIKRAVARPGTPVYSATLRGSCRCRCTAR